ncbi:MAG: AMP-binding protein [Novosphingobium sp.]|nr:AMP-binding protein [Novosphingobium sp.]
MAEILLGDLPESNAARLGEDRWAIRHGDDVVTWGGLADRARRRGRALSAAGIGVGDRVVLALPNSNALFELTFALWKIGATPTMVSSRLPRAELEGVIALAEPRAVIAAEPALRVALDALPPQFGVDHPDGSPFETRVSPCWKVMTSGGSTGRPKLIVDHGPARMDSANFAQLGIPEDGVLLNAGPLYHNFPFATAHIGLINGCSVVGMEKFDAERFLDLVEQFRVEWVTLVPTTMNRIARLPRTVLDSHDMSSLRAVWHTAAPMPPTLKRFWIDWLGPERVWEIYGGSEGFATTQIGGLDWLERPGSVGRCVGGEIRIVGPDGESLPPGEVGEIYMRREGVTPETANYHYVGAESRRLPDGFESLGDHGRVDEDGFLFIADRRTDLILSGGHNIYPAEVESALLGHPDVAEAIVIGLPHADMGAVVHAIVRLEPGTEASVDDLLAFAAENLVAYKLPRTIEFTDQPLRDEMGKARRSRLREERIAAMEQEKG